MAEFDLNNPASRKALTRFTEKGAQAGCPFCKGRMLASVTRGDRIYFLKGPHVGQEATVSDEPGLDDDEFMVKFDFQESGWSTRVNYKWAAFVHSPMDDIPKWLCSLSTDDLCAIDEAALQMAPRLADLTGNIWSATTILPLIAIVRQRRLPVAAADLWPTLGAHGFSRKLKADFCRSFDFGLQLLVLLNGRPAIKKKRVKAMSIGRY
jgi:hypothetical protein